MLDHRYSCFISADNDSPNAPYIKDVLAKILFTNGVFAWQPEDHHPKNTTIIRRAIEQSDYFIIIATAKNIFNKESMAHYLELEYLYAKQLNKPIIVIYNFTDADSDAVKTLIRHSKGYLANQLQQESLYIKLFNLPILELSVRQAVNKLIRMQVGLGWVRPDHQRLSAYQAQLAINSPDELEQSLITTQITNATTQAIKQINIPTVQTDIHFAIHFKAQIYEAGNVKDVDLTQHIPWLTLIKELGPAFRPACTESRFAIVLADLILKDGLTLAKKHYPDAHALTRVQVSIQDLHILKSSFEQLGWIVPIGRDDRDQVLWELTEKGFKQVSDILSADIKVVSTSLKA